MRLNGLRRDDRASALWGRKNEVRKSALWGRGGRGHIAVLVIGLALAAPLLPAAASAAATAYTAGIPTSLLKDAQARPDATFRVIVQASRPKTSGDVSRAVGAQGGKTLKQYSKALPGVAASVSGRAVLALASNPTISAITPDVKVVTASYEDGTMWKSSTGLSGLAPVAVGATLPAIAIVDSGIQSRKEFPKISARVNLSSNSAGLTGDQQGHGTMVAGLAAGNGKYSGAAQSFPLIDVRTADAQGQSLTSDVISACDWILANKTKYNIRVANFSMTGDVESSFTSDPLDKAVEKLWFNGVVVVAAAGNGGSGSGSDAVGAPANDPFVITVGALDQHKTADPGDDTVPSWSTAGYTLDGFQKPELSAPGRYMIAPVPAGSTFATTFPERIVDPEPYMWMSGTSFAAPVVSGAAAQLLYRHPDWTPGQVKGALMLTARRLPQADVRAGVGEIDAFGANALTSPPNANENLDAFVVTDSSSGGLVFDAANWSSAVSASASWSSANWSGANWSSANWSTANWASASWSSANWATANWATANWASASWAAAGLQ